MTGGACSQHPERISAMSDDADATLFICVSCTSGGTPAEEPGLRLLEAVAARLPERAERRIMIKPVDCLAVCKRPCTIALAGHGKWTYVIGDLDHRAHIDDVIAAALSFGATSDGIIPWRERPQSFRKGVIARIPPLGFKVGERSF